MSGMPNRPNVRLFIVDDHPIVREGTAGLFRREEGIEVVGAVGDAAGCLQLVNEERPDVLLLDLHLPDMSGIELVRRIRAEAPEVEIVVLTGYDYLPYLPRLRRMGVERVLSKVAREAEIVAAVRAAGAHDPVVSRSSEGPKSPEALTAREHEVLEMLAEGKRNQDIAGALAISLKTVEFHVANLLSKLATRSRWEAVRIAQQRGVLPPGSPPEPQSDAQVQRARGSGSA